jgi:hypothetical protein
MNIGNERLKFALRFAQMELPKRKPEWDMLRQNIGDFVSPSPDIIHIKGGHNLIVIPANKPQELTEDEIRELQADVARIAVPRLNVRAERVFPHWKGGKAQVWDKAAKIYTEWSALIGRGDESTFIMRGKTHDIFLSFLLLLLLQASADRFRRCPAPIKRNPGEECGKLFLRNKRGIYCSTTCQERAGKQGRRKKQQTQNQQSSKKRTKTA